MKKGPLYIKNGWVICAISREICLARELFEQLGYFFMRLRYTSFEMKQSLLRELFVPIIG